MNTDLDPANPTPETEAEPFVWLDETGLSVIPAHTSARVREVLERLRQHPNRSACLSTHKTRNAAHVAKWRWRNRLNRAGANDIVSGVVELQGFKPPYALVMTCVPDDSGGAHAGTGVSE